MSINKMAAATLLPQVDEVTDASVIEETKVRIFGDHFKSKWTQ